MYLPPVYIWSNHVLIYFGHLGTYGSEIPAQPIRMLYDITDSHGLVPDESHEPCFEKRGMTTAHVERGYIICHMIAPYSHLNSLMVQIYLDIIYDLLIDMLYNDFSFILHLEDICL